ncbi:uncharacterized protein LTR77_002913 [Saxophila tyrrhenica]|uniref:Oxidase ustYa n=1 Tax=Saxophila tyrrhenica TaxID=1690608 RepID=A0AAV9PK72_9PEZI|nr:hypothetical protein LTR77_002913 [Saxophila tyrrhenica]
MPEKVAYQPLNDEASEEAGKSSTPPWARHDRDHEKQKHWSLQWLRLASEIVLVALVFLLSLKIMMDGSTPRAGRPPGPNDPKQDLGYSDKVFMNESKYANEGAFLSEDKLKETLASWVPLSSKGRGYVEIPKDERDTLDGPPYLMNPLMRPNKKEIYMVSGFHQLHCLSTIMASYARLRFGKDESEMGFHIAHCFDYLREGILCAGDATLEGNNTAKYPGVKIPWGTSHRCANWDALREWADERTVFPFPPGLDTTI